ncbi:hypothetical protein E2542_SST09532 [Spatholobus suberectus]|nr:hypothetical protein E2542_SST09532 [Spatholobus suberectus]
MHYLRNYSCLLSVSNFQNIVNALQTTIGPSYLVNDIRCCVSVLGWVGFFYTMWLVTRKSLGFAKRSLSVTGSAITSTLLLGLPITFHPKIQFRRWSHIEACVQILHMHVLKWQKLLLLTDLLAPGLARNDSTTRSCMCGCHA